MNFSYINFPPLPEPFIKPCISMSTLVGKSEFLNKINELEGPASRLTYIPPIVHKWLFENVIFKHFKHYSINLMMPFIHISTHSPLYERGEESHPIHIDYGRKYAFNYFLDAGGDNVWTYWYDNEKNIIEKHHIKPFRWHMIAVNPEIHSADGIEEGRKRICISLNWDPPIPKPLFNAKTYWGDLLLDE